MIKAVVGIDIGGTSTKFGIVDRKGQCLGANSIATGQYHNFDKFLEHLHQEIQILINSLGKEINIKNEVERFTTLFEEMLEPPTKSYIIKTTAQNVINKIKIIMR